VGPISGSFSWNQSVFSNYFLRYTINEENVYVFSGHGAEYMWLLCIPPLVGWFGLAWIICTHERVTCFNYKKLLAWVDVHGEAKATEEEDLNESGGFRTIGEAESDAAEASDRGAKQGTANRKRPRAQSLERNLEKARGFAAKSKEKQPLSQLGSRVNSLPLEKPTGLKGYEKLGTEEQP
jgi:hypothetical protein